jgi:hypothetical protein
VRTLQHARHRIHPANLPLLKIAVTFFGPLEPTPPARIDFLTRGMVCRSRVDPWRAGGALPNTQVFTNDIEQYRHARSTNAGILEFEPHDILTHTLVKRTDPGDTWLPWGLPYHPGQGLGHRTDIGQALTERAWAILSAIATGSPVPGHPLPHDLLPVPTFCLAVTLYHVGLSGCGIAYGDEIETCLHKATRVAWEDTRFVTDRSAIGLDDVALSVSVVHDREYHGRYRAADIAYKLRLGLDSATVMEGTQRALMLPSAAVYFNWNKTQMLAALQEKAGIKSPTPHWATFRTTTWLQTEAHTRKLEFGFCDRSQAPYERTQWRDGVRLLGSYIQAHLQDGLPSYLYFPVQDRTVRHGSAARIVHALASLADAADVLADTAWRDLAHQGLRQCLDHVDHGRLRLEGCPGGPMADAVLLSATVGRIHDQEETLDALADRLAALVQSNGRLCERPLQRGVTPDNDYLPGGILLALARYWSGRGDTPDLSRTLTWYRRRFRIAHPWGLVGWQTQAWAVLARRTPEYAVFVFEMADYLLEWQHERTGAFMADLGSPGLSFHTGWLCEGLADAWRLAEEHGDGARATRYAHGCDAGFRFLQRLFIRDEDTFCTPRPDLARGGVRGALNTSEVRIDYVSHVLTALCKAMRAIPL